MCNSLSFCANGAICAKPRAAYFRQEKIKLDRFLNVFTASGAAIIPGFVLIGIEHDGFLPSDNNGLAEPAPESEIEEESSFDDKLDEELGEPEEVDESIESLEAEAVTTSAKPKGVFKLTAPIFDPEKGIAVKPISFTQLGTAT